METSQPGRIVVGVGRSLGAYQALRYAVAEARRRDWLLVAIRVFRLTVNAQGLLQPDLLIGSAKANLNIAFTEALGGLPRDVNMQIRIREGSVARTLVEEADRETDFLIIGGCGCRTWTGHRHTSIARFCAGRALCPVLIVPPPALARSARADRLARDTTAGVEDYLCRPAFNRGTTEEML
jgi:nucleotide-binding universal stress UspA family protein